MGARRCYGIAGGREIGPFGGMAGIRRLGRAPGRGGAEAAFAGAAERTPGQGCDGEFLKIQDAYLCQVIAEKGVTDAGDLKPLQPELYLWQGDITP